RTDRSGEKPRAVYLHRQIMGEPSGFEVDHIDGNGLDNRRANLRVASKTQNVRNQRIRQDNTSSFKGVSWSKRRQKW
ncbi:HNH endonuclease, partial [Listeria monocytogenes]|uniref:HNH endonuclease n=1 Tax=Listeria monocytogenes TaxID=1639 RepID=UPI002FDBC3DF